MANWVMEKYTSIEDVYIYNRQGNVSSLSGTYNPRCKLKQEDYFLTVKKSSIYQNKSVK